MTRVLVKTIPIYHRSIPMAAPLWLNTTKTVKSNPLLLRIQPITLGELTQAARLSRHVGFYNRRFPDRATPHPITIPIAIHRLNSHRAKQSAVSSLGA